jgi:transposase-like protein
MEEHGEVQGKRKRTRALRTGPRRAGRPHASSHPFELRRKAVQLCLEEGFPVKPVARELGVGFSTLGAWVRRYRAQGEAGLQGKARARSPRPQVAAAVQHWAELLAHDLNHRPRRSLQGQVACRVFQDARLALQAYTLRKRREVVDEINALTWTLMQAQEGCTQDEADMIRRVAVQAWLQKHQVITITQNHRVLPVFLQTLAYN